MSAAPQLLKVLKLSIEVVRGPSQGEKFSFEKSTITAGRGPENDIVFAQDVKVSRQHIEFRVTPTGVTVRNLSQKNAIAVDGEVAVEKALRPGASVRLGETEVRVNFEKPPEQRPALAAIPTVTAKAGAPAVVATSTPAAPGNQFPAAPGGSPLTPSAAPGAQPPSSWSAQQGGVQPGARNVGQSSGVNYSYSGSNSSSSSSRVRFYVIVGVFVLGAAYFFTQQNIKKKTEIKLRDTVSTEIAINDSEKEYEKIAKEIERKGQDTIQYRLAQEQYLRGFRDYRQGQYVRAMEEFQAALSFYPGHDLARKYYTLAKRKFDEQVQFNMIQGKRYYGVNNYRLCMGYYSNVIKMKKDERDPIRREALQYYNECEIKMRGKY